MLKADVDKNRSKIRGGMQFYDLGEYIYVTNVSLFLSKIYLTGLNIKNVDIPLLQCSYVTNSRPQKRTYLPCKR